MIDTLISNLIRLKEYYSLDGIVVENFRTKIWNQDSYRRQAIIFFPWYPAA